MLLAQVQEAWIALSKQYLAILADTGDKVDSLLGAYSLTTNHIFQPDGSDLYDSDCDDISTAKAVLMVNLLSYGSDILSEVPHFETYHNDMDNQSVHAIVISSQHVVILMIDDEEALILEECSIDKKLFEIEKKELKLENKRLSEHNICQDVVNIVMDADDKSVNVLPVQN
nr:hypothetical protein [Tanacetum cinerariifolium]